MLPSRLDYKLLEDRSPVWLTVIFQGPKRPVWRTQEVKGRFEPQKVELPWSQIPIIK